MFKYIFAAFLLTTGITVAAQQRRFTFTTEKMGSPFSIVFYADDSLAATAISQQCFSMVDSFNLIFSDYNDSSELSKLSASSLTGRPVIVSPALFDILLQSKTAFEKSGGAFDITIGPLVKLWRQARRTKQFPSAQSVANIRRLTGGDKLLIDTANKIVTLHTSGMQLDLGGIAKGWIAGKIIDFLNREHITHALVNAGGDIAMSNPPPGTGGWVIGVNVPETTDELLTQTLELQNIAVATSGDAYQFMENNHKKYSHIIDPRSGYGITTQRNVTVIAKDATTADWLATACSIIGISKAKKLATRCGAALLITEVKKEKVAFHVTDNFARYWRQRGQ